METMNSRLEGGLCGRLILPVSLFVAAIAAGCASWGERLEDRGESRFFEAEWEAVFAAVRSEAADREFAVRRASEREGRLTALSPLRPESSFGEAHQTELEFYLEEGMPGEVEVLLVIHEIRERNSAQGPAASRVVVRRTPLHRQILDGVAERLGTVPVDEEPEAVPNS